MSGNDSKQNGDDALERAEFERAEEELERSLRIKPSKLMTPPKPIPVMSKIHFHGYPLIWLGEDAFVYVHFLVGEQRLDKPLDVTWTSLDPGVLSIRETGRQAQSVMARLVGASPGTTRVVATTQEGHREELEVRVVDRDSIEIQWF
ncbi:hypothetical protein JY651_50285 [Pyxidicoccus parkwayensis]|jgi:hypothetical protein|uniref:Uncharacterized protein n=1 Tax=Pyxidicoccus parkwayensis TaxID=2813578 RepID=A0ABX7NXS9_9BACT|nr:hypothetical protein [Pyxidicoccus parkwaysis]QSQ23184.1 hypothetical protein JY651_50285 [Pyxidicoccus parkwaysis]